MALVNQGGSLILRNGALATGQACCCSPPCSCSQNNPFPLGCNIDYIVLQVQFRFADYGHDAVSMTIQFQPDFTFFEQRAYDSTGCEWMVRGYMTCQPGGQTFFAFGISRTFFLNGEPSLECARPICTVANPYQNGGQCDSGTIGSWNWSIFACEEGDKAVELGFDVVVPTRTSNNACCPQVPEALTWGSVCSAASGSASLSIVLNQ